MDYKDQELINRFFKFVRGLSLVVPSLSKEKKLGSPIDIAENAMEFINKMIDGVAINLKALPSYMTKIFEINRNAQKAFGEKRYSDYVMLKYKVAEIFYKSLYQELFNKVLTAEDQLHLCDIIKEIEHNFKIDSGISGELNDWKKIRNKIVHEDLTVNKTTAVQSRIFFDKLYKLFKTYIKELKISQKKLL